MAFCSHKGERYISYNVVCIHANGFSSTSPTNKCHQAVHSTLLSRSHSYAIFLVLALARLLHVNCDRGKGYGFLEYRNEESQSRPGFFSPVPIMAVSKGERIKVQVRGIVTPASDSVTDTERFSVVHGFTSRIWPSPDQNWLRAGRGRSLRSGSAGRRQLL